MHLQNKEESTMEKHEALSGKLVIQRSMSYNSGNILLIYEAGTND